MKVKSDKIVFVNQNSGYLMIDIVNAFNNKYKEAVLITGQLIKRYTELNSYAKIVKIVSYKRQSNITRLYSWILATTQIVFKLLYKYNKGYDLFLVSNPPFTGFIPILFKRKYSLLIYDTYPDILINHHLLKENSIVSKCWKRVNRKVFNNASNIYTISEGMADCLAQYTDRCNIKVIPNWSNTSFLKPLPKENNPFVKEYHLEGRFVVLYSGNMGATHDVESIIELAAVMKNDQEVIFVLIGEGIKKVKITSMIIEHELNNCILLPYQKVELLPLSLSCADIGIVTIDKETSLLSVPSKTYSLMAVGAVLLCIGSQNSELGNLVKKYNIGDIFEKHSINEMREFILNMKNNKDICLRYSLNSRKASFDFTQENALLYVENYN